MGTEATSLVATEATFEDARAFLGFTEADRMGILARRVWTDGRPFGHVFAESLARFAAMLIRDETGTGGVYWQAVLAGVIGPYLDGDRL